MCTPAAAKCRTTAVQACCTNRCCIQHHFAPIPADSNPRNEQDERFTGEITKPTCLLLVEAVSKSWPYIPKVPVLPTNSSSRILKSTTRAQNVDSTRKSESFGVRSPHLSGSRDRNKKMKNPEKIERTHLPTAHCPPFVVIAPFESPQERRDSGRQGGSGEYCTTHLHTGLTPTRRCRRQIQSSQAVAGFLFATKLLRRTRWERPARRFSPERGACEREGGERERESYIGMGERAYLFLAGVV